VSTIDDVRKALQDFLAPEVAALKAQIEGFARVEDARFAAAQTQYAAMMTNMELIKQQMKNNHDALMTKLDALMHERDKVA
jgi:ABC-type phosphate transport system auxiliary subunit